MRISDWSSDVSSSDLDSALARRVQALQHHDRPPLVQDVRHIIITHLDFDHAGGIEDFPAAAVHLTGREKVVADSQEGGAFVGRRRYRPQQWDEVIDWRLYPMGRGERWFGFEAVRDLDGLPPEILLVPLPGHTWGHSGVAVQEATGRATVCN